MDDSEDTSLTMSEILVALDHSRHSRAALDTAAAIAKLLEAKIHGLFVHDDQWLRISRLPSLAEIDELTGSLSPLGRESIEKEIRELERAIKEHFELISRRHQLTHTWSTVKGVVAEKVLDAAKNSDMITIGSRGRSFSKSGKLGSTAATIIQTADKPVLILQKRNHLGRPPIVIFDGSDESVSGVNIALKIAKKNNSRLTIIDMSDAFPSKDSNRSVLDRIEIKNKVLKLDQPNMGRFLFVIHKLKGGLLILPKNESFTSRTAMEHILECADCPVMLSNG